MILYQTYIEIIPRTKKNSMRVVRYGRRAGIRQSKQYEAFEQEALAKLERIDVPISCPVNCEYTFYMPTRRKVDGANLEAAMDDTLVNAGILADDNRDIVAGHDGSRVYYQKDSPGVKIVITAMQNYEQWSVPS